jgi:hypothetical protein
MLGRRAFAEVPKWHVQSDIVPGKSLNSIAKIRQNIIIPKKQFCIKT